MNHRKTLVVAPVVGIARPHPGVDMMLDTARLNGLDVTLVGAGRRFTDLFDAKVSGLWAEVGELTGYDHVLMVDATDTLFAAGLGEVHHWFDRLGHPFLMSAERLCWPWWARHDGMARHAGPYRHLNSGGFLATWDAFRDVYRRVMDLRCEYQERGRTVANDDQAAFSYGRLEAGAPVGLDVDCRVFQCLAGCDGRWAMSDDFAWGRRPYNLATRTCPCVFHCNGREKWRLPDLYGLLMR